MQHKTILTQGGIVHYWIARNKNVSDCIVFTHGVTADHTMFEKQIPYFSDNYAIILWDVPTVSYTHLKRYLSFSVPTARWSGY